MLPRATPRAAVDRHVAIHKLSDLIAGMSPRIVEGSFVFVTIEDGASLPPDVVAYASVREREGLSCLIRSDDAGRVGASENDAFGWISLDVESALDAVGLTAAVSAALTDRNIPCNVIAGHHHDHLLVPLHLVHDACATLEALAQR